ncbi:30S ribosomal protein S8 [Candidatus Endomicrobiellum devescovinae]|jgi:small subunit ribosomal protein S8|uniref:30S ribosomal protein S8 n=1 Tax=Candidatus Endomicrobiellum devescovinae TaxID=3242322 RepID=UPI0028339F7A|nr:30S ribosomal protein S8 [Endomicrobium sp.]MDR1942616.1 30S ribosomal protein S8 [Endomicrobium sp.]
MITDPISDMFARIRNANVKLHEKVDIPSSKMKMEIAKILKEEGYIASYKITDDKKQGILRIYLKYTASGKPVLEGIKRVSKSSLRIYKGYEDMPKTVGGLGVTLVSTSKGLMTDNQARKEKVGGEIIGYVW